MNHNTGKKHDKIDIDVDAVSVPIGNNVFHQVCVHWTVKMLEWLLQHSGKDRWKKYLNTYTKNLAVFGWLQRKKVMYCVDGFLPVHECGKEFWTGKSYAT